MRMREDFSDAAVVLMKGGVLPPSLQRMFSDDRILDVVEQLGVGPSVALNPAWNLRGKMPSHEETVVPWHQDNSCECSLLLLCLAFAGGQQLVGCLVDSIVVALPSLCWWSAARGMPR
jgi:hypothetical protein